MSMLFVLPFYYPSFNSKLRHNLKALFNGFRRYKTAITTAQARKYRAGNDASVFVKTASIIA